MPTLIIIDLLSHDDEEDGLCFGQGRLGPV